MRPMSYCGYSNESSCGSSSSNRIQDTLCRSGAYAVAVAVCVLVISVTAWAQLSLTNNTLRTINFSGTVSGVSNGAYTGAGFQATPTAGQLDSDAWAATGWSDGDLAFGGTRTTAATDYTRGAVSAAVGTGGFYAYTGSPGSAANPSFMFQAGGSDFAPGTLTLRMQNNGVTNITNIVISYNIFVRNDQLRSSSFNFSYSSDNSTYTAVGALDYIQLLPLQTRWDMFKWELLPVDQQPLLD